jgi:hypothetical protein
MIKSSFVFCSFFKYRELQTYKLHVLRAYKTVQLYLNCLQGSPGTNEGRSKGVGFARMHGKEQVSRR